MGLNLHDVLKLYEYNKKYYRSEGVHVLFEYIEDYASAHPWFHCYWVKVEDSEPDKYFHYALIYWTDGQRPTLNTFNFIINIKLISYLYF